MAIVGFSTGAIAYGDFKRALRLLGPTRAKAVELSALRSAELSTLLLELPSLWSELQKRYRYVSFHAPTDFLDEDTLVGDLMIAADMGLNIVVHPDTLRDASPWKRLGRYLTLENLDSRRATGRTAEELRWFYDQLPEARLCFDIAHARQIDSSMTAGLQIVQEFRDRLVQVHLSEVNSRGKHFPMSFSAKRAYLPFSEILSSVPVIIESVVASENIAHEIAVAESLFEHRERDGVSSGSGSDA